MYRTGNYSTTYLPHPTWVGRSVGRCGTRDRRLAGGERHAPTPSPGLTTALRRGKERAPRCAADLSPCRRRLDAPRVSPRTHARSRAPGAAGWVPGKWTGGGGGSANRGNCRDGAAFSSPPHRFAASPRAAEGRPACVREPAPHAHAAAGRRAGCCADCAGCSSLGSARCGAEFGIHPLPTSSCALGQSTPPPPSARRRSHGACARSNTAPQQPRPAECCSSNSHVHM